MKKNNKNSVTRLFLFIPVPRGIDLQSAGQVISQIIKEKYNIDIPNTIVVAINTSIVEHRRNEEMELKEIKLEFSNNWVPRKITSKWIKK